MLHSLMIWLENIKEDNLMFLVAFISFYFLPIMDNVLSPRSRRWQIWCLVKAWYLVNRWLSSCCVLTWQKKWERSLWGLFYKYPLSYWRCSFHSCSIEWFWRWEGDGFCQKPFLYQGNDVVVCFFFSSLFKMWCIIVIDFSYVEPYVHSWDKCQLIMVYMPFICC